MAGNQTRFQEAMKQATSAAWDGAWSKAADYYRQALQEMPNHPVALSNLGLALYEMHNYKDALPVYQKAIGISPSDPVIMDKIADLQERLGNYNAAISASLKAAELHAQNRDVPKAIECWKRVIRINPLH